MQVSDVRLLLVDDDPSAIQVMSRMLSQYSDQRFANSGEDALRLAREVVPDIILLDADMPGMSGFTVLEALKSDRELARVPVIIATSHDAPSVQVAALEQGAADFVTKPLVAAQLTARVRAQLRTKALIQQSARARSPEDALAVRDRTQSQRLLIVDDDVSAIQALRQTLEAMGDFHFAKSGEEALQMAHRLLPDLILLDAQMPGIDGFEVCASLKAEPSFKHVPIIFVTRFSDPRNEMRALDLGASDFIAKPYTPAVLQARVRNLLELKRRTDTELQAVRDHWRKLGDARVADIVSAASDAIVTANAESDIVLINAAACRMFGVTDEWAIGRPLLDLLGNELNAIAPAEPSPTCIHVFRKDGTKLAVEVSTSQVGDGPQRLMTVMLRDVSDRERLEAESRARTGAEAASRAKTMVLSYIAQEMGNPLNGLLGFARLMASDTEHPLAPEQAARLEHIVASGRHWQSLMRDVLDVGLLESGSLNIEPRPVDAHDCIQAAIAAVSALALQTGVTVTCSAKGAPIPLITDTDRLHQCLVNLLSNAIKYNRSGGSAHISAQAQDESVALLVRDSGVGMSEAQRQNLFEPFTRFGQNRVAVPGAGLGLVITRRLVEAMGGRLFVESEPGVGSSFRIVLPRHVPASAIRAQDQVGMADKR